MHNIQYIVMRILSVISGKGGVGKTTLVANLGAVLASKFKKNVILLDSNVSASNLGLHFGIDQPAVTLNHVLKGTARLHEATYAHFTGVKVIPASLILSDIEGLDISKLHEVLKASHSSLAKKTDVLLIDCSPGLGRETMAAVRASDEVLYVTIPYVSGLMNLIRCHQTISELDVTPLGTVLNMVDGYKHELSSQEMENLSGVPVLCTIPLDRNVLKSHALRIPVVHLKSRSPASRSFTELAQAILKE